MSCCFFVQVDLREMKKHYGIVYDEELFIQQKNGFSTSKCNSERGFLSKPPETHHCYFLLHEFVLVPCPSLTDPILLLIYLHKCVMYCSTMCHSKQSSGW